MRPPFCLLLLVAACSFPELAQAPDTPRGPPPGLSPLGPLVTKTAEPDVEADTELMQRAKSLRIRAAGIPRRPINLDPERDRVLEARTAALRKRAEVLPTDPIEPEKRAAMERIGQK